MSGLYHGAMRGAALALFVLSVITLVVGVYTAWRGMSAAAELQSRFQGVMPGNMLAASVRVGWAQSLMGALNAAAIPFFGAGLLWRLDRFATDRSA